MMNNQRLINLRYADTARLMFIGDVHGNTAQIVADFGYAAENNVDAIIAAGDFGVGFHIDEATGGCTFLDFVQRLAWNVDIPIFFVDGNHENFDWLETWTTYDKNGIGEVYTSQPGSSMIFHISRGGLLTIGDVTIMGFGGAISVDRNWREEGQNYWRQEEVTLDDYDRAIIAADGQHIDILVTHDAPWNPVSFSLDYHTNNKAHWETGEPYFPQSAIDDSHANREIVNALTNIVQPTLHFHGHMHKAYDYFNEDIESRTIGLDRDTSPRHNHSVLVDLEDGMLHPIIAPQRDNALNRIKSEG